MKYLTLENIIYEYVFRRLLKKWISNDFIPNDYKYFLHSIEIGNWGHKENLHFMTLKELRNKDQATKQELFELTSFDYYQGYVGERMNNLLRGTNSYLDNESLNEYIESISIILDRFKLEDNIIALRRTNVDFFKKMKKNSEFIELGFLSTSINLSHREDTEGNTKLLKNEVLLVLKIPSNTKALYVEHVQEECRRRKEYELLIQQGSRIKIEKSYRILSNKIVLGTVYQN